MKNSDEPISPILGHLVEYSSSGLSKREQACIQLCVPETGDPELDEIIRKAQRAKFSGLAMQGLLSRSEKLIGVEDTYTKISVLMADLLLAALEKQNDNAH